MIALFIGRFQPFHLGHLHVINAFHKTYDLIKIGIGSSQYHHTLENPFTYDEREKMISETLNNEEITNYKIIAIPDIHNPSKWVDHVGSMVDTFSVVLCNNDFTTSLFEQKGFMIKKTDLFHRDLYSGKEIRKRIQNNQEWKSLVPVTVYQYILDINGVERIKNST